MVKVSHSSGHTIAGYSRLKMIVDGCFFVGYFLFESKCAFNSAVGRNLMPCRPFFQGLKLEHWTVQVVRISALETVMLRSLTPRMNWIWNEYDVSLHH